MARGTATGRPSRFDGEPREAVVALLVGMAAGLLGAACELQERAGSTSSVASPAKSQERGRSSAPEGPQEARPWASIDAARQGFVRAKGIEERAKVAAKRHGNETLQRWQPGDLETIVFRRTRCYGFCPVFDFEVRTDSGWVVWFGKEHVDAQGRRERHLSDEGVEKIRRLFAELDFFSIDQSDLDAACEVRATDHPTTFISVYLDGAAHTLRHYRGCMRSRSWLERLVLVLGGDNYRPCPKGGIYCDLIDFEEAFLDTARVRPWIGE